MSEERFNEAKGDLALSQQLLDKVRMPQQDASPEEVRTDV